MLTITVLIQRLKNNAITGVQGKQILIRAFITLSHKY